MPMTNYFICCEECFEDVCKVNSNAVRIWMNLCSSRSTGNEVFCFYVDDIQEVRDLERLGLVISTEQKTGFLVKVIGHMKTTEGDDFFCAKGGDHG